MPSCPVGCFTAQRPRVDKKPLKIHTIRTIIRIIIKILSFDGLLGVAGILRH